MRHQHCLRSSCLQTVQVKHTPTHEDAGMIRTNALHMLIYEMPFTNMLTTVMGLRQYEAFPGFNQCKACPGTSFGLALVSFNMYWSCIVSTALQPGSVFSLGLESYWVQPCSWLWWVMVQALACKSLGLIFVSVALGLDQYVWCLGCRSWSVLVGGKQSGSASPFVLGFRSEYIKVRYSVCCCEFNVEIRVGMKQELHPAFLFQFHSRASGREKTIPQLIFTSFIGRLLTVRNLKCNHTECIFLSMV